jgi:hypothetical protein
MDPFTAGKNLIADSLRDPQMAGDLFKRLSADGRFVEKVAIARPYHTSCHRLPPILSALLRFVPVNRDLRVDRQTPL